MSLRFHVSGIPLTTKKYSTIDGLERIKNLNIDGMEMDWVQNVPFDEILAEKVGESAKRLGLSLSVHGSYFINLASKEPAKFYGSIARIVKAGKIAQICGADRITFHAGFYQNLDKKEAYDRVKEGLVKIKEEFDKNKLTVKICPETTGKPTQFGSLEELVQLAKELKIGLCIDFSHLHARTNGKFNTKEEFEGIFDLVEKNLGGKYLKDMYFHLSGILYSEKGEKNHVCFLEKPEDYLKEGINIKGWEDEKVPQNKYIENGPDIKWKEIFEVMKKRKIGGIIVIESPCMERDVILAKEVFKQ